MMFCGVVYLRNFRSFSQYKTSNCAKMNSSITQCRLAGRHRSGAIWNLKSVQFSTENRRIKAGGFLTSNISSCRCLLADTSKRTCTSDAVSMGRYDADKIERKWLEIWKTNPLRRRVDPNAEMFSMCLPPPNVTGKLHLGHALTATIQDTLTNWHRMQGKRVCWIPGFDHAGIATQTVIEKRLWQERQLKRDQISEEEFIDLCDQWNNQRQHDITEQLTRLGARLDWNQRYYTLDENFQKAVARAFKTLFDEGLIFRDRRLINWCSTLQSTISDQEVSILEINQPNTKINVPGLDQPLQVGYLYTISYQLEDKDCGISVATTRPETILADVAIAVHPNDPRYSSLIGKMVMHPLDRSILLPIIADKRVQRDKGTGAVKITPGHDKFDYIVANSHSLPLNVGCFDEFGQIESTRFPEFNQLHRFQARITILDRLGQLGALVGKKFSPTTVPLCSRSDDVIEPRLRTQWFLNCRSMSQRVIDLLDSRQLSLQPEFTENLLRHWLNQSEDWCLSRQLLWGHKIPAYKEEGLEDITRNWQTFECRPWQSHLVQDSDVLDTWFSSSLVPLVAAGYPNKLNPDIYPLSLMETGHDILGFWVARMLMVGLHLTKTPPFKSVLFHGLIRDGQGRKMSKSTGNVIDPIDAINGITLEQLKMKLEKDAVGLPKEQIDSTLKSASRQFPLGLSPVGADALRFTLLRSDVSGVDVKFDAVLLQNSAHFLNKLWNAFVFAQQIWKRATPGAGKIDLEKLRPIDWWILGRLQNCVDLVNTSLANNEFHMATQALYDFLWLECCDIYLETIKPALRANNQKVLSDTSTILHQMLSRYLRLCAPFVPFLTEELHQQLVNANKDTSIHDLTMPSVDDLPFSKEPDLDRRVRFVMRITQSMRGLRNHLGITKIDFNNSTAYVWTNRSGFEAISTFGDLICRNTNIGRLETNVKRHGVEIEVPDGAVPWLVDSETQIYLSLKNVDRAKIFEQLSAQKSQIDRKMEKFLVQMEKIKETLNKDTFTKTESKRDSNRRDVLSAKLTSITSQMERLGKEMEVLEELLRIVSSDAGSSSDLSVDKTAVQ